jgi:hypothetical protein
MSVPMAMAMMGLLNLNIRTERIKNASCMHSSHPIELAWSGLYNLTFVGSSDNIPVSMYLLSQAEFIKSWTIQMKLTISTIFKMHGIDFT